MASHVFSAPRHLRAADQVFARRTLAVFVAAHGLAHLVGTERAFARAADGGSLDYLGGNWTLSDPTTLRAFGVLWAAIAVAFLATGAVIWVGRARWPVLLWWVSVASLVLVLVALWASVIGLVVDIALLVVAVGAGAFLHERPDA